MVSANVIAALPAIQSCLFLDENDLERPAKWDLTPAWWAGQYNKRKPHASRFQPIAVIYFSLTYGETANNNVTEVRCSSRSSVV